MEEPKTLSYDWQYGREELFLRVDSYMSSRKKYSYGSAVTWTGIVCMSESTRQNMATRNFFPTLR